MMKIVHKYGLKNTAIVITIIISAITYLFVGHALKQEPVKISKLKEEKRQYEEKPLRVDVTIQSSYETLQYRQRMQNTQSYLSLLSTLKDEENLQYEITSYVKGDKVSEINSIVDSEFAQWKTYITIEQNHLDELLGDHNVGEKELKVLESAVNNRLDITYQIKNLSLVKEANIEFVYEPIQPSELQ